MIIVQQGRHVLQVLQQCLCRSAEQAVIVTFEFYEGKHDCVQGQTR